MFPFLQIQIDLRERAQDGDLQGVADSDYTATGQTLLYGLVTNLLTLAMVIGALIAFAFLVLGGIEWITSGGDKSKIDKAREKLTGSIIGLLVLASTVALFMIIQRFLGISVLPFGPQP